MDRGLGRVVVRAVIARAGCKEREVDESVLAVDLSIRTAVPTSAAYSDCRRCRGRQVAPQRRLATPPRWQKERGALRRRRPSECTAAENTLDKCRLQLLRLPGPAGDDEKGNAAPGKVVPTALGIGKEARANKETTGRELETFN